MKPNHAVVELELWRSDAVVLFDWLVTVNLNDVPITHPSQKQALFDLRTQLESQTDVDYSGADEIVKAQGEVAADMGW
jgi:hypothetical protein